MSFLATSCSPSIAFVWELSCIDIFRRLGKMRLFVRGLQLSSKQYKDRTLYSQKPHQIWILYSSLLRIRFVTLVILWNYILHSCSHSLDPNDPTLFDYSCVNMFPDMAGSYVPAFGRCLFAIFKSKQSEQVLDEMQGSTNELRKERVIKTHIFTWCSDVLLKKYWKIDEHWVW